MMVCKLRCKSCCRVLEGEGVCFGFGLGSSEGPRPVCDIARNREYNIRQKPFAMPRDRVFSQSVHLTDGTAPVCAEVHTDASIIVNSLFAHGLSRAILGLMGNRVR